MIIYNGEDLVVDGSLDILICVFRSEAERLKLIENLSNMPSREGLRLYAEYQTQDREEVKQIFDKLVEEYGQGKSETETPE